MNEDLSQVRWMWLHYFQTDVPDKLLTECLLFLLYYTLLPIVLFYVDRNTRLNYYRGNLTRKWHCKSVWTSVESCVKWASGQQQGLVRFSLCLCEQWPVHSPSFCVLHMMAVKMLINCLLYCNSSKSRLWKHIITECVLLHVICCFTLCWWITNKCMRKLELRLVELVVLWTVALLVRAPCCSCEARNKLLYSSNPVSECDVAPALSGWIFHPSAGPV